MDKEELDRIRRENIFLKKLKEKHIDVELVANEKYINNITHLKFYCKRHDNYFNSSPANILKNKFCCNIGLKERECYNKFTKETFQKRLSKVDKYLEITSEYINALTNIEFKCNKCGVENQIANPNNLLRGVSHCGVCSNSSRKLIIGYTDLYTTHPQYIPYFKNKEDAKNVTFGSSVIIDMNCPICGHKKKLSSAQLTSKGFGCPKCGEGTSYPNRFMFNLLEQLDVEFSNEIKFPWSKNRRYDFMVGKTLIEMDGGFHNGSKFNSKEKVKKIDLLKDELAIKNGYKIIRIQCFKSKFELIKETVLNSELKNILKLEDIDWIELEKKLINTNLVKRASDIFNKYKGEKSITEMAELLNMKTARLCILLKTSARVKMSNYDANLSKCGYYNPNKEAYNSKSVICLETNNTYKSCLEAEKEFKLNPDAIARVCRGERLTTNGLHFDFINTTDEIQNKKKKMEESESKPSHSAKRVLCIELDKIFESSEEANKFCGKTKGYVSGLISKNRKTKDGYTFKYI